MKALRQKFLKLPLWVWIFLGALGAGGLLTYALTQPQYAGWRYGACKVFLEHTVRFPKTIIVKDGGEGASSAMIQYSDINPFGSQQVKVFECYYSGTKLSKITQDRKMLPDDVIARFNQMLPIILTQELDTALPRDVPSRLEDFR